MLFMDPVWDSFPFYMRTVQSRTVTIVTRVGSATDTKSDRSEFVFRPVPCKRMKRNVPVYMESDTNSYRFEFVPVSCIYPTLFSGTWPLCFWLAHERGCVAAVHFILFNFAIYPPSIAMELKVNKEIRDPSIYHFHIDHNAHCLPPKILHNHCFQFLLGITVVPREIEDNGYAKFWEVNKVHYGLCKIGEYGRQTMRHFSWICIP